MDRCSRDAVDEEMIDGDVGVVLNAAFGFWLLVIFWKLLTLFFRGLRLLISMDKKD